MLPLEFARVSLDKRLTLVLHQESPQIKTFYATHTKKNLDDAMNNLLARETPWKRGQAKPDGSFFKDCIGYVNLKRNKSRCKTGVEDIITAWCRENNYEAAI